jgi:hypothetical protein
MSDPSRSGQPPLTRDASPSLGRDAASFVLDVGHTPPELAPHEGRLALAAARGMTARE